MANSEKRGPTTATTPAFIALERALSLALADARGIQGQLKTLRLATASRAGELSGADVVSALEAIEQQAAALRDGIDVALSRAPSGGAAPSTLEEAAAEHRAESGQPLIDGEVGELRAVLVALDDLLHDSDPDARDRAAWLCSIAKRYADSLYRHVFGGIRGEDDEPDGGDTGGAHGD